MNILARAARPLLSSVLPALLAAAVPVAPARAETPDPVAAAVEKAFRPLMQAYDVPGLAVAVTAGGRARFFSFGVASREGQAPVTPDTLFEIGSLSKTFTATLLAGAVAEGRLSLADHPGRFLPALRGTPIEKASLLNLATYTAGGLPLQFPEVVGGENGMPAYFAAWQPEAAPGTLRQYSNPSIGLAGYLAARALGGPFESLMASRVFAPLGLRDSYIRVPDSAMARYAWGYAAANRPIRVNPGLFAAEAYGVKTTARDLIRFVEANIRPDAESGALRRAIVGTHVGYFTAGAITQGLGWEQYAWPVGLGRLLAGNDAAMLKPVPATPVAAPAEAPAATLFNKTGSTNGFGAYAAFVPAQRIGIVVLANRNFPIPARIRAAWAVLEALPRTP